MQTKKRSRKWRFVRRCQAPGAIARRLTRHAVQQQPATKANTRGLLAVGRAAESAPNTIISSGQSLAKQHLPASGHLGQSSEKRQYRIRLTAKAEGAQLGCVPLCSCGQLRAFRYMVLVKKAAAPEAKAASTREHPIRPRADLSMPRARV